MTDGSGNTLRVPQASGALASPDLDAWMESLDRHLMAQAPRPDLPLDLRGTAFQIKVWRHLLRVSVGLSCGRWQGGVDRGERPGFPLPRE